MKCVELKCDQCFLNKHSVLHCDRSGFTDPAIVLQWEKFKDFVQQLAQQYFHTQLDKLTTYIHRPIVTGVDAESKHLVLHCDFSQDLAHAMADQSMCEYFDIISSSLFIAVAHFWDPVTNKRECEGVTLPLFFNSQTHIQVCANWTSTPYCRVH